MKKNKLSIVISAYNEEGKITQCLESASFADEIVFVDNSSADKTVEIAKKFTDKIFIKPNNLMLNTNKNFGFSKATGDWILSLDADERITLELKEEMLSATRHAPSGVNGFWLPRKNIIFGKWIKHTGWYPDYQLRLFKKDMGSFSAKHVHEMITLKGETAYVKEHILHYNYDSISQFLTKLDLIYTSNEAEQLLGNGYVITWADALKMPIKEFVSRFFAREGYKDGFHGLMLSILMAFYHFIVFAKIWEKQGFNQISDAKILPQTEIEVRNAHKEIMFWFFNEKIKSANGIKKLLFRLRRHLI
ncbi:MAG: glycosyltransferase family 2 protein [Candidatus Levyibacteriota bacterium]|nr:MAG: glycosyltransferase family 2 protein [Candidatus Levybacteria bacterium]